MPASACLRIVLDLSDEKLSKLEALGPLVAKVTSAFLEGCWSWPKRFESLTPFSFMLTDPRATELDIRELEHLADELQLKLFGASGAGMVTLLLHDAPPDDTTIFVQMDPVSLKAAIAEPLRPTPFGGRLMRISPQGGGTSGLKWVELDRDAKAAPGVDHIGLTEVAASFRGVYFTPGSAFIGCLVTATPPTAAITYSLVDSADLLPPEPTVEFDLASLAAAISLLERRPFTGVLYTPICFSSMMRRSTRTLYEEQFQRLPLEKRNQLGAAVYAAPRSPPFHAFGELRNVLARHFSTVDLQVADAGFEVDHVPQGGVASVTLRLPDTDERSRLIALKRFMSKRDSFKRRQIWPALTNVRSRAELQMCLAEKAPFITGPAICGPMSQPIGSRACDQGLLPLVRAA